MADRLQVLIPTSGLGSRLGELTEYTNKALVRVGTKAVVSHIVDSYPKDTKFLVMLGHKGDLVRQYLTLAHPDTEVEYMDLEMRTEENLGLVGAIQLQQEMIGPEPLVFHASDTIVTLPADFLNMPYNSVLGYPAEGDVSMYRMIRSDGRHTMCNFTQRIMEKGEQTTPEDMVHIGVVRFQHPEEFCAALEDCDAFDCDTHVLNAMVNRGSSRFSAIPTVDWFDTGNMSKLAVARKHFEVKDFVLLEKLDQGVYIVGDRVVKFFSNPDMVSKRMERAAHLKGAIPEILGCTTNFFAYLKADGEMARDAMHPVDFEYFLDWAMDKIWSKPFTGTYHRFPALAREFYQDKTADRVAKFYEKTGLSDQRDVINGRKVPTLAELLSLVDWEELTKDSGITSGMHGDLHFSNILMAKDWVLTLVRPYTLLDWRESFAGSVDHGDVYYDLAKLLHGLIVSHDMVEKNLFSIQIREAGGLDLGSNLRTVSVEILRHQRHVQCEQILQDWCERNGWSWRRVRLLCALVYLNIATLHHHPYDKFLYFLGKSMIHEELSK